jgi:hypothetical protein
MTPLEIAEQVAQQESLLTRGSKHYVDMVLQPLEAMEAWMPEHQLVGFYRGNAIKYLARMDRKGAPLEDLKKAQHYVDLLVNLCERGQGCGR